MCWQSSVVKLVPQMQLTCSAMATQLQTSFIDIILQFIYFMELWNKWLIGLLKVVFITDAMLVT